MIRLFWFSIFAKHNIRGGNFETAKNSRASSPNSLLMKKTKKKTSKSKKKKQIQIQIK